MIIIFILNCLSIVKAQKGRDCGPSCNWTLENGTLTIEGSGKMYNQSGISPWDNYKNDIKKVIIGEGITSIGKTVFQNHQNLENVILSNTIREIHEESFLNCENLINVKFGNKTELIY